MAARISCFYVFATILLLETTSSLHVPCTSGEVCKAAMEREFQDCFLDKYGATLKNVYTFFEVVIKDLQALYATDESKQAELKQLYEQILEERGKLDAARTDKSTLVEAQPKTRRAVFRLRSLLPKDFKYQDQDFDQHFLRLLSTFKEEYFKCWDLAGIISNTVEVDGFAPIDQTLQELRTRQFSTESLYDVAILSERILRFYNLNDFIEN